MITSQKTWRQYVSALKSVNEKAATAVWMYIRDFGLPESQDAMDELIEMAEDVLDKYGEASAALAADYYDLIVDLSGKSFPPAVPASLATTAELSTAIVGTVKTNNPELVAASVGRLVKMAGVDTTMQNAIRDGAEWAWVPMGDTCAFCITLASRGWQKASKKALKGGHATHIHANCDCTYAVRFNSSDNVEGYDPGKYLDMYQNADGTKSSAKINSMRRAAYARNAEAINAQKRDAYAKRKERESSAAEEINA